MKVLFDHQVFSWQKVGGISRYFVELIKHMNTSVESMMPSMWSENVFLSELGNIKPAVRNTNLSTFRVRRIAYEWLNRRTSSQALMTKDYSLLHPTYYDPYFLKLRKSPYVITVHDFTHEKYPHFFKDASKVIANKRLTVTNADRVIAISENTKKDIIDFYGIPEEKIEVIYHGATLPSTIIEKVKGLPSRYILFVGDRNKYKNFSNMLEAFALLEKNDPQLHLVCTGKPFNNDELIELRQKGLRRKVHQYFVTNPQLSYLYTNACCFVFPSLYEGFGLPILEAWASNCPIALSNASCFPEIAREGAAYFNPEDPADMAHVIGDVIYNESVRKELLGHARYLLPQFTWQQSAFRTVGVYYKVLYGDNIEEQSKPIW